MPGRPSSCSLRWPVWTGAALTTLKRWPESLVRLRRRLPKIRHCRWQIRNHHYSNRYLNFARWYVPLGRAGIMDRVDAAISALGTCLLLAGAATLTLTYWLWRGSCENRAACRKSRPRRDDLDAPRQEHSEGHEGQTLERIFHGQVPIPSPRAIHPLRKRPSRVDGVFCASSKGLVRKDVHKAVASRELDDAAIDHLAAHASATHREVQQRRRLFRRSNPNKPRLLANASAIWIGMVRSDQRSWKKPLWTIVVEYQSEFKNGRCAGSAASPETCIERKCSQPRVTQSLT